MPRWDPDARMRLVEAALDLFVEQGYEQTGVAQIAERAGLTKSTFFRHFRDKREVLFAGQEVLTEMIAGGIAGAPEDATPLEAVGAALEALAGAFPPERHAFATRLRSVTGAHPELQEREALKRAGLAAAMAEGLRQRGVADPTAGLAAELGMLAFRTAFARWAQPDNPQPFAALAGQALEELQAASAALH